MTSVFEICVADEQGNENVFLQQLSHDEWRKVFVSGQWENLRPLWFQPQDDAAKRVTFEENLRGPQLS